MVALATPGRLSAGVAPSPTGTAAVEPASAVEGGAAEEVSWTGYLLEREQEKKRVKRQKEKKVLNL